MRDPLPSQCPPVPARHPSHDVLAPSVRRTPSYFLAVSVAPVERLVRLTPSRSAIVRTASPEGAASSSTARPVAQEQPFPATSPRCSPSGYAARAAIPRVVVARLSTETRADGPRRLFSRRGAVHPDPRHDARCPIAGGHVHSQRSRPRVAPSRGGAVAPSIESCHEHGRSTPCPGRQPLCASRDATDDAIKRPWRMRRPRPALRATKQSRAWALRPPVAGRAAQLRGSARLPARDERQRKRSDARISGLARYPARCVSSAATTIATPDAVRPARPPAARPTHARPETRSTALPSGEKRAPWHAVSTTI